MNGGDGLQTHVHRAIDRCAGALEDAGDPERLVLVMRETHIAQAMGDHHHVALLVAELPGYVSADHGVVKISEALPGSKTNRAITSEPIVFEIIVVGPHHSKPAVRVTERDGDRPGDVRMVGDLLVTRPADVSRRIADAKHGVEQQVELSGASPDDEIDARHGVRKTIARCRAHLLHAEQQRHADGDGADGEQCRGAAVTQRAQGQHQAASASLRCRSSSEITRSNRAPSEVSWLTNSSVVPRLAHSAMTSCRKSSRES